MQTIDLTGQVFDRFYVLRRSERGSAAGAKWVCRCSCGAERHVNSLKLRRGLAKSCGCARDEATAARSKTHGLSNRSPTYRSWKEMRQRCNNPERDNFGWYGGRGIDIAPQWGSYPRFLADMGERPAGKTLDRVDNTKGYGPGNCQWLTPLEQTRKQEKNRLGSVVEALRADYRAGLSCRALGEKYGVSHSTAHRCATGRTWGATTEGSLSLPLEPSQKSGKC